MYPFNVYYSLLLGTEEQFLTKTVESDDDTYRNPYGYRKWRLEKITYKHFSWPDDLQERVFVFDILWLDPYACHKGL